MFETKKIFQVPKSKIDEILLPFSGGGPKMAHLEFRGKMPKIAKNGKNCDFSKNIPKFSLCG